jgi:hypothetical protein
MQDALGIPLNCGTIAGGTTYVFKKPVIGEEPDGGNTIVEGSITLLVNPVERITNNPGSTTVTQDDLAFDQFSTAATITDYEVQVQQNNPNITYPATVTSSNTSIILDPVDGLASGVAAGTAVLIARADDNSNIFSAKQVTVAVNSSTTTTTFTGYATGSLAKNATDAVDTRISGKTASTAKPIFSTMNHSTATYTRNTGGWAYDVDLTPISPWNSTGAAQRAGTLISPRHILFAAHYQISTGATIRFVDASNNVITRTMTSKLTHPDYKPYFPDLTIGILDSDVPSEISFAKILPQDWADYLPSLSFSYRIPAFVTDQQEKGLITDLYELGSFARFRAPTDATRLEYYENLVTGDSGNPAFLIINNELVLLTVWTYGGAGSGTNILAQKITLNAMMTQLGGGYSLTEIDLSSFNNYG